MNAPNLHLLGLVCGLPPQKRNRRLLLMLQAYLDESISERNERDFVMGGYLATYEQWAEFNREWQNVLDMNPRIEYFKYKEALNGDGPFHGMNERNRNERIEVCKQMIEKYAQTQFAICFRIDEYERGFAANIPIKELKNPYYFASLTLILDIARNLDKLEIEPQPIEFIFDMRVKEKGKIVDAWDWARENTKIITPTILDTIIKSSPIFRDDKEFPPLQAADMLATVARIGVEKARQGEEYQMLYELGKNMKSMLRFFNEEQFKEQAKKDIEDIIKLREL